MSDGNFTLKRPRGPTPEACYRCGTTDAAQLVWPEPWQNPVVLHQSDGTPARFCWDCTINYLTPLSVDFGEPDGEAVQVEQRLVYDQSISVNKVLRDWWRQPLNPPPGEDA